MTVLHLATPRVYPHPGGMEEAVLRIGRLLGSSGRSRVIVHTTHQAVRYRLPDPAHEGIEVAHLSEHRSLLMEPLEAFAGDASGATPSPYQLEVHRADYLLLHAAVQARIQRHPDAAHLMISFYASTTGFLAQQVALALGIPHVASVRGSDYSRDMRNPYHCQALRFAAERIEVAGRAEPGAGADPGGGVQWRRYFTPERERADWESAIAEASGPCLSMSA